MVINITEDEKWELIGFVKVSNTRLTLLKALKDEFLMPKELAENTGYSTVHISQTLQDLKSKNLVKCMNEKVRKGRIYHDTELGLMILNMIDK